MDVCDEAGNSIPMGRDVVTTTPTTTVVTTTYVGFCGDGLLDPQEECDDGNIIGGDGCSAFCTIEQCFTCSGEPSRCDCDVEATCGSACVTPLRCTDVAGPCRCGS